MLEIHGGGGDDAGVKKIGVLLSGGVDSSAALMRVKEADADADVTAYYLKIWLEDELAHLGGCPWEEDLAFARGVCDLAGVPLKVMSLQREYWERVVAYTIGELEAGRTPSPDVLCNRRVKFGAFLERVGDSLDKAASGHYAVVDEGANGVFRIRRSPDAVKDQTYFLSHLTQDQAGSVLFPIGGMRKGEVRALARGWGLPNKDRRDSQGICFLGKIRYADFVRHYLGEKEGEIIEAGTGRVLGKHRGSWFYTIGQRTGLGLGGGPWYVLGREKEANVVFVGSSEGAEAAAVDRFRVVEPNWISGAPEFPRRMEMKLRHGPRLVGGVVSAVGEDGGKGGDGVEGAARAGVRPGARTGEGARLEVKMDEPDRGVAAGQFAVFYDGDVCLGGGMIAE